MAIPVRKIPAVPGRKPMSIPVKQPTPRVQAPKKVFTVEAMKSSTMGEKILIYAETGMGKSTLASLAPKPAFIDLDNGCAKLRDPVTGGQLVGVPGVETFQDVRTVLQQPGIFVTNDTVVIDNATILQDLAEYQVISTVATKGGKLVPNIEAYGFKEGYKHLYDVMKSILQDCDNLIKQGKNVIIIAQANPNRIANPSGEDYLCQGPRLYSGKPSIEAMFCEWADHILYIAYQDVFVSKDKKATGGSTRVIYTQPEVYFRAKSRQLKNGGFLPPIISFSSPADGSLWTFMMEK